MENFSNKRRNMIKLTCLAGLPGLVSGCITESMLKSHGSEYEETVSSVLLSSDNKTLVVIGDRYHYIIDAPKVLVETLQSDFHKEAIAVMGKFTTKDGDKISGKLSLYLKNSAPEDLQAAAIAVGYSKITRASAYACEYYAELTGKRYFSNNVQATSPTQKLNQDYKIKVYEPESSATRAFKTAISPITMTADGVLWIGGFALALIVGPIFGIVMSIKTGKPT